MDCAPTIEQPAKSLSVIRRFTWGTPIVLYVSIWLSLTFTPDGSIFDRALGAAFLSLCAFWLIIPVGIILGLFLEWLSRKTREWVSWTLLGSLISPIICFGFYDSLPSTNFRDRISDQMRAKYTIQEYKVRTSFNDGWWHFFKISCDEDFVRELANRRQLIESHRDGTVLMMNGFLKPDLLPDDAAFYRGGNLAVG